MRWSRTRCTCCRRGRGGASSWVNGSSPSRSSTSRSIRNAFRRRDVHVCRWGCGSSRSHNSRFHSICISCSPFSSNGGSIAESWLGWKREHGDIRFVCKSAGIKRCRPTGTLCGEAISLAAECQREMAGAMLFDKRLHAADNLIHVVRLDVVFRRNLLCRHVVLLAANVDFNLTVAVENV